MPPHKGAFNISTKYIRLHDGKGVNTNIIINNLIPMELNTSITDYYDMISLWHDATLSGNDI